jgi:hypothetical protein
MIRAAALTFILACSRAGTTLALALRTRQHPLHSCDVCLHCELERSPPPPTPTRFVVEYGRFGLHQCPHAGDGATLPILPQGRLVDKRLGL